MEMPMKTVFVVLEFMYWMLVAFSVVGIAVIVGVGVAHVLGMPIVWSR
jgi:hypothetical protein